MTTTALASNPKSVKRATNVTLSTTATVWIQCATESFATRSMKKRLAWHLKERNVNGLKGTLVMDPE